jgi:maltose alpha-D-glucosyltransferase/alpha-amylase
MGDDLSLPERNCARTPMQWSTEPHGGFTKSDKPVLPVISGGPFGFEHTNVAHQRRDPESMLNWMERLIRMRKEAPEIGWGTCVPLQTNDKGVLALRYDWRNNSILVIHNLNAIPVEVEFEVGLGNHGETLIDIADSGNSVADEKGKHCLLLDAYAYRWYRVGGLDYLLKRREI